MGIIAESQALRRSSGTLRGSVEKLHKSNCHLRAACRTQVHAPDFFPGFAPAVIRRTNRNWRGDLFECIFKGREVDFLNPGRLQLQYARSLVKMFRGEFVLDYDKSERVAHFRKVKPSA